MQENIVNAAPDPFWEAVTTRTRGPKFSWDAAAIKAYKETYLKADGIHAVSGPPSYDSEIILMH